MPAVVARKRPRQSRSKETVRSILDAAAAILIARGYDSMSTNAVAERAGVSIGSLYQYFPGKEAIVAALIDEHITEEHEIIRGTIERMKDAPLPQAVAELIDAVMLTSKVNPKLKKVFLEQIPRVGKFQRIMETRRTVEGMVVAYFERHAEELRPARYKLAAFMLTHAVDAVVNVAKSERPESLKEGLIEELNALILRYLYRG